MNLPKTCRTLLKTPCKVTNIKSIPPGEYYHFGILKGIGSVFRFPFIKIKIKIYSSLQVGLSGGKNRKDYINSRNLEFVDESLFFCLKCFQIFPPNSKAYKSGTSPTLTPPVLSYGRNSFFTLLFIHLIFLKEFLFSNRISLT